MFGTTGRPWLFPGVLLILSGTVFLTNLGGARFWDRDEPRNAGCASEMLARGDWIVPTFNDQLRSQKPVLLYWLMMGSFQLLGESEFAARWVSAVAGIGSVLLTYGIGRRLIDASSGFLGGVILATTLLFCLAARAATPDSILIFCSTAGLYGFVRWGFRPGEEGAGQESQFVGFPQRFWQRSIIYGCFGLAVLAKGPIGCVLPMSVIGLYLLLTHARALPRAENPASGRMARGVGTLALLFGPNNFFRALREMRWLSGLTIVLAVAAPWYLLVGWRTEGEFLQKFFWDEHFGRATTTFESHSGGWWFYPIAILVGMFPWSVFAVPVGLETDRWLSSRWRAGSVFLMGWGGLQLLVFSLVQTKLPSYVTPCFPAVSLLCGASLVRYVRRQSESLDLWYQLGFAAMLPAGLAVAAGLYWTAERYLSGHWELVAVAVPLIALSGWAWRRPIAADRSRQMIRFAAAAVAFCLLLFGWATDVVDSTRRTESLLARIRTADEAVQVAAYECLESSWIYYGGRPIVELRAGTSLEANEDFRAIDSARVALTPVEFTLRAPQGLILTTAEHLSDLLQRLPQGYTVIDRAPYFLRDEELILVGRTRTSSTASRPDPTLGR